MALSKGFLNFLDEWEKNEGTTRGGNRPGASAQFQRNTQMQTQVRNPAADRLLRNIGLPTGYESPVNETDIAPFRRDVRALGANINRAQLPSQAKKSWQENLLAYNQLQEKGAQLEAFGNAQDMDTKMDIFRGNYALGGIGDMLDAQKELAQYNSDLDYILKNTDTYERFKLNLSAAKQTGDEQLVSDVYKMGMEREMPVDEKLLKQQEDLSAQQMSIEEQIAANEVLLDAIYAKDEWDDNDRRLKEDIEKKNRELVEMQEAGVVQQQKQVEEEIAKQPKTYFEATKEHNRQKAEQYALWAQGNWDTAGTALEGDKDAEELSQALNTNAQKQMTAQEEYDALRMKEEWTEDDRARMSQLEKEMAQSVAEEEAMYKEAESRAEEAEEANAEMDRAVYGDRSWKDILLENWELHKELDTKAAKYVGHNVLAGVTGLFDGLFGGLDFVLGRPINYIGKLFSGNKDWKNWGSQFYEWSKEKAYDPVARNAERVTDSMGDSAIWDVGADIIQGVTENIPMALAAAATGGVAAAGGIATTQANAIKALGQTGMSAAEVVGQNIITNPQYWTSFLRESGGAYEEAKNAEAGEITASLYAMLSSLINSTIEIGPDGKSGIQGIGWVDEDSIFSRAVQAVAGKDVKWLSDILESGTDEGIEELKQGIVSALLAKITYAQDKKLVGGEDALFNPEEVARNMAVGFATGGVLAGGNAAVSAAVDAAGNVQQDVAEDAQNANLAGKPENTKQRTNAAFMPRTKRVTMDHVENEQRVQQGKEKAQELRVSETGMTRVEENGKQMYANIVGVEQKDGQTMVHVQTVNGESVVPADQVEYADKETAERVMIASEVGGEELANTIYNAKAPTEQAYDEYAKEFAAAYTMAKEGATQEEIRASAEAQGLHDAEIRTAVRMAEQNANVDTQEEEMNDSEDMEGAETAFEFGKMGRSQGELESVLKDAGIEMSSAARVSYTRGETARRKEAEARRKAIMELNRGKSGKRLGVLRSVSQEEAKQYGVKEFSGVFSDVQRAAINALRGVASKMHLNIAYFESPVDESGNRNGANGFYDSATNTVYLDVFAGKGNEQAMMRAAAHELTHVIQQWSPDNYRKLQDVLFDYYYESGEGTLRDLIESQKEKATANGLELTEEQALDEVTADACEMMFTDIDAMRQIAQTDKTLFEKIGEWINDFVESIKEAMQGIRSGTKESQLLRESEKTWEKARTIWYQALEEAGANNPGSETETAKTVDQTAEIAENVQKSVVKKADSVVKIENQPVQIADGAAEVIKGAAVKNSLRTWTEDERTAVTENLKKQGFKEKDVKEWIHDVDGIAAQVAKDKDRLDFTAADNQVMLKNNQEYVKTLDASTLCAKRLVYQGTFNAVQHALPDRVMTSDDLIDLRNLMAKKGYETPCGICYVESRRRHLGKFADEWVQSYQGEYKPHLDDVTTTDGLERLRKEHPEAYNSFMAAMKKKGSNNPKVVELRTEYRGDIRKLTNAQIKKIREIGGFRVQSFSDFETPHLLDMMQAVLDMAAKGLNSQAYTKVPNFAAVFGDTGIKINLSLIAEGSGLDKDGNLLFSSYEGMDFDRAMELREQYSENVGTILVGLNDAHIKAAMADDRIDFIIPFHKSGWGQEQMARLSAIRDYEDYTDTQNERKIIGYRKNGNPIYKNVESNFYPVDYWDFSVSGTENAENYLRMCAEDGRIPKFNRFLVDNGDGSYSLPEDGSADGYWKMLIDYKMYDNDGVGAPQRAVQPIFNMEEADRVLREYEGGADTLPVAKDVVSEFVDQLKKNDAGVKYSLRSFDDGRRFVDVQAEQKKFEGLNEKEMLHLAKKIINEKFRGKIVGIDNPVPVGKIGAKEYVYPSKPIKGHIFRAKMKAAPELDNLIDAGVYEGSEPDGTQGHTHKGVERFDYYTTTFKVGKNYFEGRVNVSVTKNGERYFKDITKIKNITQAITRQYGDEPHTGFLRDVSMNSISENGEGVNENIKFSLRDNEFKTDRQILAGALESVTKDAQEAQLLREYQEIAAKLDADERRVQEINAEIRELRLEKPNSEREAILLEERRGLEKGITSADRRLFQLESLKPLQRVAKEMRKNAERDLERAKRHMEKYREGVKRREHQGKIEREAKRLSKWLTQPNNKRLVPESLRGPLAKFLLSIDMRSYTELKKGEQTKKDREYVQTLDTLTDILRNVQQTQDGDTEAQIKELYSGYIDLPKNFVETLTQLVKRAKDAMEEGTFTLQTMSTQELEALDESVSTLSRSLTSINELLTAGSTGTVSETAKASIDYMQGMKERGPSYEFASKLGDYLNWENATPMYAFERYGEGGKKIFRSLQEGQNKLAFNVKKLMEEMKDKDYTAKEARAWAEDVKEIEMPDGKTMRIPVTHIMSLYCLAKREQAQGHIYGGGVLVNNFKIKGKTYEDNGHLMSPEMVEKITGMLTEKQRNVADKMQRIMNTTGSEWGNYVSVRRFGYKMFKEQNYFPIEVDENRKSARTDDSKGNELYRLLNMSMTKQLTPNASNRLVLKNIFDVYSKHMTDMAQYNALALPALDAVKWLNWQENDVNEDGQISTQSLRDAARYAYGNVANKYIVDLLKDINGVRAMAEGDDRFATKAISRYNRAAVAANLRVALLQPLSIVRAGMELPGTSIAKGISKTLKVKDNVKEMMQYSGIAVWKDIGGPEMNVSRSVTEQIKRAESVTDRIVDASMKGAELMDKVTWAAIWQSCKEYVNKRTALEIGSEAYFDEVARKFEDVIYRTQVVDSVLTKSKYMRAGTPMKRMLSAFMSEPTTSYNLLLNAYTKMNASMRRGASFQEAWQKSGKLVMRTAAVYTMSALLQTLVEQIMTAYRDDDDYETFMDKAFDGAVETLVDNVLPTSLVPIFSQMTDIAKTTIGNVTGSGISGFDQQNLIFAGYETLNDGIELMTKWVNGELSGYTPYGAVYKTLSGLSSVTGIPVAPAMREVVALVNNTYGYITGNRIQTYRTSKTAGYQALFGAIERGDDERAAEIRTELGSNNTTDKQITSGLTTQAKNAYLSGDMTAEEATDFLMKYGKLTEDKAYFKLQEWGFENESDDDYSVYMALEEAVKTGTGVEDAAKELTEHGYTQSQVNSKVREFVKEAYLDGEMQKAQAESMLKKHGGLDANETYFKMLQYDYEDMTGESTSSDACMIYYAIDNKQSPKAAIDDALKHGKQKSGLASSITSHYKEEYLKLAKTDVRAAAALKGRLITVFDYLGYKGKEKVEGWEK